jgi:predicted RNA-binding Zn-ribbon protein involved in translation (DUF1610 family)
MLFRNIMILLIDLALGALMGLEIRLSLLGKLFVEPFHHWMPVFFFALLILWILLSLVITRRWTWTLGGTTLALLAATAIPLFDQLMFTTMDQWISLLLFFLFVLVSTFLVSFFAEYGHRLVSLQQAARQSKVRLRSPAGPFWFLFSLAAGAIFAITLYNGWIPQTFASFLGSSESFRLAFYLLFGTIGGILTVSASWAALSAFIFVFISEFLTLFLFTAYTTFGQMLSSLSSLFIDPYRMTAPVIILVVSTLWSLAAGGFTQRYFLLREVKREQGRITPLVAEVNLVQQEIGSEPADGTRSASTDNPPIPEETSVLFPCPNCGRNLAKEALYCPSCGVEQNSKV